MQWVEHARVMPPSDCAYARAALAGHPRRARRIFERALEMRELIWTIGTALAEQRPIAAKLLAVALGHPRREPEPRRDEDAARQLHLGLGSASRHSGGDPRPDHAVGLDAGDGEGPLRTRRCAGQECGWLFFDTTKNNRRRWCEMRVCGNRAKVRAVRERQRLARKG